jgi:rod shape-determining protein MreC
LLVTDNQSAVPVQVLRNGVRAIVEGVGKLDEMRLRHVSMTTDIVEGDVLISSGLGGRYPAGYPVARVVAISARPGEPFRDVVTLPVAKTNTSRHFLLVVNKKESVLIGNGTASGDSKEMADE